MFEVVGKGMFLVTKFLLIEMSSGFHRAHLWQTAPFGRTVFDGAVHRAYEHVNGSRNRWT